MKYNLKIGWLYPELMNIYGDRGNMIVLKQRCLWRGIDVQIINLDLGFYEAKLEECDILIMGGAQDKQQETVALDLFKKAKALKRIINKGVPGLYICGAYQFLGHYYKDAYGTKIPGLGVFDMYTESSKTKPRLIGNIVIQPSPSLTINYQLLAIPLFVGFENHGGHTFLADPKQAFAKVITGYGNNGTDKTEGIHYKTSIGTYLHGPILPSNPELAVYLLQTAYQKKYGEELSIEFDDELSTKAKVMMLKRLKTSY